MNGWTWLIIAIVVVLIVIGLLMTSRRRRTASLRGQFGPEYERVVEDADSRRAAESDLRDRQRERDQLEIRPLPETSRVNYLDEWRAVQERFVDQPSDAVDSANGLLTRVMTERGYPVADFEDRADLISVDHPQVVENYRFAHRVHESNLNKRASTEDLREAFLRYRSLFEEMLASGPGAQTGDTSSRGSSR